MTSQNYPYFYQEKANILVFFYCVTRLKNDKKEGKYLIVIQQRDLGLKKSGLVELVRNSEPRYLEHVLIPYGLVHSFSAIFDAIKNQVFFWKNDFLMTISAPKMISSLQ